MRKKQKALAKSFPKVAKFQFTEKSLRLDVRCSSSSNEEETMKKDDFDFGVNLEQLILEKFNSIASFAREIGKNRKTVGEWLGKDGRFPSKPEDIKAISLALGVSVHELMFGTLDGNEPLGSLLEKTEIHTGMYEITVKKVDVKNRGKK